MIAPAIMLKTGNPALIQPSQTASRLLQIDLLSCSPVEEQITPRHVALPLGGILRRDPHEWPQVERRLADQLLEDALRDKAAERQGSGP